MKRSRQLDDALRYVCVVPPPSVVVPKNRVAALMLRIWRWL